MGTQDVAPRRPSWRVVCSCGWTRDTTSAWAAESVSRLHPRLAPSDVAHAITIEPPPDPTDPQLPLV